MGKKAKDKKKGKGAEKTALKTDKKLSSKQKKKLNALGEDDIETILAEIEREEQKRTQVTEHLVEAPSRRINFTFVAHPDKEELILFGGEYFNGQKTFLYNDLLFYNIAAATWTLIKAPAGPPPRCGHQMVALSANKGQLWLFGGEYASPTQSQFYHYRDLWVYHIGAKRWEKVVAANGPSARSGHRMVVQRKQLFVFGGFHDNLRDYRYFNDVYRFDLETYAWSKLEPSGVAPAPRSGCCMLPLSDGKILVYGGYCKERIKKDVDQGRVFSDAFLLTPEKNDTTGLKYKWVSTKIGGVHFSPRCSMLMAQTPNQLAAYVYGGVFDVEEDEEHLAGQFFNDLLQFDAQKLCWHMVTLSGRKENGSSNKARRRNKENDDEKEAADDDDMEVEQGGDDSQANVEALQQEIQSTTISDDGVFKVTIGPAPPPTTSSSSSSNNQGGDVNRAFQPSARMNCGLAIKHGTLYLYGGMYEDGNRDVTYADLHCLDLKKLDEWRTLISDDSKNMEWIASESESEDDDDDENDDEEEDDDDDEEDEDDGKMET